MNDKKALIIIGTVFALMSFLGALRVFGPGAQNSILGQLWWLDSQENVSHLAVAIICLAGAWLLPLTGQKILIWFFAAALILISIYSVITFHLLKINVEAPVEEVIYFTLGDLALWAAVKNQREQNQSTSKFNVNGIKKI